MAGLFDDLVPGDAPAGGSLFDDLVPTAPAGAGGGRGMAPGKTAQQEAELVAATGARRGTMRGVNPYVAEERPPEPKTVLERPYTEPLPPKLTDAEVADMARQQTAPWKREEIRKQGEYVTGSKAGALAAAPAPSVVDSIVATTRAKPLDNSLPAALLQRSGNALAAVEDLRLSGVGGLFQTMELGADALRLATGTGNDGLTADLSEWARRSGDLVRKAKSPELRQDAAELSRIIQDENANIATVLGFLISHPRLLASQAVESAPTMLVGAGTGRTAAALVERLSLSALKAAPATPAVVERIAELSAAGGRAGAVAGETLLGAGGVYADVLREGGSTTQAATAAGLTAIGYALIGRATGGGAEAALANRSGRGALRVAGMESAQEGGQSLVESASQAAGLGRDLDIAQALKQASNEALIGGIAGGAATALQGQQQPAGTSPADRALGGALAADLAERDFQQAPIDGYAARASDPRFYDPTFVDPRATVMPRAPRVEEMPTTPFTPEQTAAMAAESQARKQAQDLAQQQAAEAEKAAAKQAEEPPQAGAPATAAPPADGQTAEAVGIRGVPRGALAASAEDLLRQNAQSTAGATDAQATAQAAAAQPAGAAMPARQAGGDEPAAAGSPVAALAQRYASARQRLFNDAATAERRAKELRSVGLTDEADKLVGRARLAKESATSLPIPEEPKDGPELRAFNRIADAFEELTGRRPVAYVDRSARASDGFFDPESGAFLVNLHNPQRSVAFTIFHEFQHLVRQKAKDGDAQAQRATQMLDQVWGMIPAEKKRSYAEKYLFRARIESGQMTVEQALDDPVLKDEMLSDFMGGKADDAEFFRELARKDPKTFGSFAQRWIDTLAKLVKSLLGRVTGGNKDIQVVAEALERSKLVAEKVLREWAAMNPKLAKEQGVEAQQDEVDQAPERQQDEAQASAREGSDKPVYTHEVIDPRDGNKVMGRYQSPDAARRGRDRLDNAHGGYRYQVRPIGGQKPVLSAREPYSSAPNPLMGMPAKGSGKPAKGFGEQRYRHVEFVRVTWDDGTTMVDAMAGLNKAHAMERARRNWTDAASIEPISREVAEADDPGIGAAVDDLLPRRSARDDELGAFSPFQNDESYDYKELTEEELAANSEDDSFDKEAELRAEMEEALAEAAAGPPQRIKAPSNEALQAAGIMAESAYRPLRFEKDKRGSGAVVIIAPNGKEYSFEYVKDKGTDGYSTLPDYPPGQPGFDMGSGYNSGLSESMAQASLGRIVASIDLFKRGFDLIDAVPYKAGQRVIEAWKAISRKRGAFAFGKDLSDLPPLSDRIRLLREIGERMVGDRYEVTAEPTASSTRIFLQMADRRTGEGQSAEIEVVEASSRGPGRVVLHTADLEAGSGAGKAFYQVGLAFASAAGLPVNADPAGLTGVNTYRRTEQMLSAALRNGKPNTGQAGAGQRIYGWTPKAKTGNDQDQNLLRLALAGARNAAELAPQAADLRYDPEEDSFSWADGTSAEDYVREALANKDARVFGLSRSTLARAAITNMALSDEIAVDVIERIRKPILYSTREPGLDSEAEVYADRAPQGRFGYKPLGRGMVGFEATIAETGEPVTVESSAEALLTDLDSRIKAMMELKRCVMR